MVLQGTSPGPPGEVPLGGPPKVPLGRSPWGVPPKSPWGGPPGRSPWGGPPGEVPLGGTSPVVPNELQKMLQKDFKRLQIEPGPANRRDFNEIFSFSRTWLDLEPFEILLKHFLKFVWYYRGPPPVPPVRSPWGVPPRSPWGGPPGGSPRSPPGEVPLEGPPGKVPLGRSPR